MVYFWVDGLTFWHVDSVLSHASACGTGIKGYHMMPRAEVGTAQHWHGIGVAYLGHW